LGLAKLQFEEYHPDLLIHVVGPEQGAYFQVIFKVLELTQPETKGKEVHLPYGWVGLKEGKMSSRTGQVVLGEWLLDEVKEKIKEKYATQDEIAEQIALGAVKYSFLKCSLTQEIAFDIAESISLEGNSGPYLQYTFARTQSVLTKSKKVRKAAKGPLNQEETLVLRKLAQFPEIIAVAAKNYSPNLLCHYLFDLAQKFNAFYNQHRIIGAKNEPLRLDLTAATGQVLQNGLKLLGIPAPQKM
jgi:arginyl-tRNA synthetase